MYNAEVINYRLEWCDALESDFQALAETDAAAYATLDVILEQLENDAELRRRFAQGTYYRGRPPRLDIAGVDNWVKNQFNIQRLKYRRADNQVAPFRLIYAVDHTSGCERIVLLGLMPRGDNYDIYSNFGRRVAADYQQLGVPRLGRC